jgi:hypothetical protein
MIDQQATGSCLTMSEFTKMAGGGMSKKQDTLIQLRKSAKFDRSEITADQVIKAYWHTEGLPRRVHSLFSNGRRKVEVSDTNRHEERLAKALYLLGELTLQDGATLRLLDYQVPLKSVRSDEGIGKIDLVGVIDQSLALVELKTKDNEEHPVDVLLEVLSYGAIVKIPENFENFKHEYEEQEPILRQEIQHIILAPQEYWDRWRKRVNVWNKLWKICIELREAKIDIQCLTLNELQVSLAEFE